MQTWLPAQNSGWPGLWTFLCITSLRCFACSLPTGPNITSHSHYLRWYQQRCRHNGFRITRGLATALCVAPVPGEGVPGYGSRCLAVCHPAELSNYKVMPKPFWGAGSPMCLSLFKPNPSSQQTAQSLKWSHLLLFWSWVAPSMPIQGVQPSGLRLSC